MLQEKIHASTIRSLLHASFLLEEKDPEGRIHRSRRGVESGGGGVVGDGVGWWVGWSGGGGIFMERVEEAVRVAVASLSEGGPMGKQGKAWLWLVQVKWKREREIF